MSHRNESIGELIAMGIGGLAGVILIFVVNALFFFTVVLDVFAIINLILLMILLFIPCLLIYCIFDDFKTRQRNQTALLIILPIFFAFIIGLMVAYLSRGDNYLYGLIVMPKELSWTIVTIIAVLLLLPFINIFSSFYIAMWLGSLIYYKIYQTSYLGRALIGSPLFLIPIFIAAASEAFRKIQSHQHITYVFDKTNGSLTRNETPSPKQSDEKLLITILAFLILGMLVAAGGCAWN